MTGGFYPWAGVETSLRRLLRQNYDDPDAGDGPVGHDAVCAGAPHVVANEAVSGLVEGHGVAAQRPSARHVPVEVAPPFVAAGNEEMTCGGAVGGERNRERGPCGTPIAGATRVGDDQQFLERVVPGDVLGGRRECIRTGDGGHEDD